MECIMPGYFSGDFWRHGWSSDFVKIFLQYSLKDLSVYSNPTRPNPLCGPAYIVTDLNCSLTAANNTDFMCFEKGEVQQFTLNHLFQEGSACSWQKIAEGGRLPK